MTRTSSQASGSRINDPDPHIFLKSIEIIGTADGFDIFLRVRDLYFRTLTFFCRLRYDYIILHTVLYYKTAVVSDKTCCVKTFDIVLYPASYLKHPV